MVQSMCVLPGNKKDYGHHLPPVSSCCFSSYTATTPCLTDAEATNSGPEPFFDGSASLKAKYDMGGTFSALTQESLGALVKKYCIPLDLRRRLPDPNLSMNHLPTDSI
ncbi:hypothetical protein Tco_1432622, partial [Tanacetum coccineum]